MFDPKTDKFPYPEYTDRHYLKIKKDNGVVFDKDYPYIDTSKSFRFKRFWIRLVMVLFVFPLLKVRLGLRIEGKQNLKKNKGVIDKGVISCCNHVHMWDYLGILRAIAPKKPYLLVWAPNIRGENAFLVRMVGGIPIPEEDYGATLSYVKAVRKMILGGGWLHIYPEGSMWEYYMPIRPFRDGAAYFARACGKPVLPMAFSYRKPGWIRRNVFRQSALFTLHIGEPVYADETLPRCEQKNDLTRRVHEAICRLAGIDPEKNVYPPVYDHSKRIDYYG